MRNVSDVSYSVCRPLVGRQRKILRLEALKQPFERFEIQIYTETIALYNLSVNNEISLKSAVEISLHQYLS